MRRACGSPCNDGSRTSVFIGADVLIGPYVLIAERFRRRRAASPFWSDPKGAKRSPGVCSDGQVTSILIWMWPVHSRYTPRPPLRGELDSKARRKNTGAGWPLTHNRSPARCHCVAKPESCPCYPLRRAFPGAPPWCSVYRMLQPCRAGACPAIGSVLYSRCSL